MDRGSGQCFRQAGGDIVLHRSADDARQRCHGARPAVLWSLREPSGGLAFGWHRYCGQLPIRVCDGSGGPGEAMRTSKTINRILRSQEPGLSAAGPMTSWRCQFCGRRFTDRTELREHLVVERQRQAGFAGYAWERGPKRTGGR